MKRIFQWKVTKVPIPNALLTRRFIRYFQTR